MTTSLNPALTQLEGRLARITGILDEMKAEQITALDLRGVANFADGFVIVTARSTTHMQALAVTVEQKLRADGMRAINPPDSVSATGDSRWVVLDYGDIIVHIFTPEARAYYDLESLWGDAASVAWQSLASA